MLMEESLPAIWASMAGWCTPTVLFIVINVVIGTIFFSSSLARSSGEPNGGAGHNLARTASVLPRLKSLNHLFRQRTEEMHAVAALLAPEPEVDIPEKTLEAKEESHLGRSVSEGPEKVSIKAEKMKKSASSKPLTSSKKEEEEEVVVRPPATMRAAPGKEDGVDAKADDFINRFKQQLKLQRLDSIIRYKEMINRGK